MRIKLLTILLCLEIVTVTVLGEIGISFDSWKPNLKILLCLLIMLTICTLLFFISNHKKVNLIWKIVLRILVLVFLICFIVASVLELSE